MTQRSHGVSLSYVSEVAPAAQRIAEAQRSAGIEVWFDREEQRDGEAWDQKIRQRIRDYISVRADVTRPDLAGMIEKRHTGRLAATNWMDARLERVVTIPGGAGREFRR